MFSIYEYNGRIFRNTLEELYKVSPIHKDAATLKTENDGLTDTPKIQSQIPNQSSIAAYRDLINANPKEELRHAFEIMQEDFTGLKETQTVYDALKILDSGNHKALPVTGPDERVIGLFEHQAITRKIIQGQKNVNIKITPVKDFLTDQVITAEPITSIRRIAEVMDRYNLWVVPVADAYDALVGIITYRDIARAVAHDPPLSLWT